MPQVIVKGISGKKPPLWLPGSLKLWRPLSPFRRNGSWSNTMRSPSSGAGKADAQSAMVVIQWKQRPKELQEKVAKALADLLLQEGSRPVEIIYQNLDMDDFYEYKGE